MKQFPFLLIFLSILVTFNSDQITDINQQPASQNQNPQIQFEFQQLNFTSDTYPRNITYQKIILKAIYNHTQFQLINDYSPFLQPENHFWQIHQPLLDNQFIFELTSTKTLLVKTNGRILTFFRKDPLDEFVPYVKKFPIEQTWRKEKTQNTNTQTNLTFINQPQFSLKFKEMSDKKGNLYLIAKITLNQVEYENKTIKCKGRCKDEWGGRSLLEWSNLDLLSQRLKIKQFDQEKVVAVAQSRQYLFLRNRSSNLSANQTNLQKEQTTSNPKIVLKFQNFMDQRDTQFLYVRALVNGTQYEVKINGSTEYERIKALGRLDSDCDKAKMNLLSYPWILTHISEEKVIIKAEKQTYTFLNTKNNIQNQPPTQKQPKLDPILQLKQALTQSQTNPNFDAHLNKQCQKSKQIQMLQLAKLQNSLYKFSHSQRYRKIILQNNQTKASGLCVAAVQGVVFEKGSSIRLRINFEKENFNSIGIGLINKLILQTESYSNLEQKRLLDRFAYLKFAKANNKPKFSVKYDFVFKNGDIVKMTRNENQLWFYNETTQKQYKMQLNVSKEELALCSFAVYFTSNLQGAYSSVEILHSL